MKKALAHDGLARGLHESARAIERGQAQVGGPAYCAAAHGPSCSLCRCCRGAAVMCCRCAAAVCCHVLCWLSLPLFFAWLLTLVCAPFALPCLPPHSLPSWLTTATSPTTRS